MSHKPSQKRDVGCKSVMVIVALSLQVPVFVYRGEDQKSSIHHITVLIID